MHTHFHLCHTYACPLQVWGGYDILLAHNTLVRVGCGTPAQELHRAAIDVLFCERSCGGEPWPGVVPTAIRTARCMLLTVLLCERSCGGERAEL